MQIKASEIPKDFDWEIYLSLYPDLIENNITTEHSAKAHYILFGRHENRVYKIHKPLSTFKQNSLPEKYNITSKNIAYFSPNAPDFDMSSGGNRLLQILTILKSLDYNIYFLHNGCISKHHIDKVQSLGIKTYTIDIKKQIYLNYHIEKFKKNNIDFGAAIFSWYDIAVQCMSIFKSHYPKAKIITDSVDLHWLREERGVKEKQLRMTQEALLNRKNIEKDIYARSDVVYTVTYQDKQNIEEEIGYHNNIKILSNIHESHDIKLGYDIFFIGGYSHHPNVQAAQKCITIFKDFQKTKTYQQLKQKPRLIIAGSNIEQTSIGDLAKDNLDIVVAGHINNLITDLYEKSILLLCPLYWGAGIKGKICDAGMAGMPILTSDIGNEGIELIDKQEALIANSDEDFVKQLQNFFNLSRSEQILLGSKGRKKLENTVSFQAAKEALVHTLQEKHIVISILTYNQPEKLKTCLKSILEKTKYNNYTIVVSNNGPNQPFKSIVESFGNIYGNKIRYIKNYRNLYFIKGNNKIINHKEYKNSDVILLNDDTEIIDGYWLNYLYSTAYSSPSIGSVGAKTIFADGTLAEAGAELYYDGTGRNIGRYEDPALPQFNIRRSVGYCSGCALYMKRSIINQIGCFSTKLKKMYYEDSEWCYRSHKSGYLTVYEPRCEIIHHEGSSNGQDINEGGKRYQEINRKIFLKLCKNQNIDIENYNE